MQILYIINSLDLGGAENILFQILSNRNKKNIKIISLTSKGFYGNQLSKKGYKVYALNIQKNISAFKKVFRLFILIFTYKPHIVHTWMYHSNLLGGISAKLLGIKKIYWSIHHDFEYSNKFNFFEMKLLALLSYWIPNKTIYSSISSQINHLKNGYKKSNTLIINNGVSTLKYKPDLRLREKFRTDLNIDSDCFLLGNISRYHPIKDHNTLLKALAELKNYQINFKCVLIGSGLSDDNTHLMKKINKHSLNKHIILYGESNEVFKIINSFDLNVLTSRSECSPVTLLESMSCGIPCLSTNVGDAKNIVGDSGWIVEPENPRQLSTCMKEIIKQNNLLKQKSKLALKRIRNFFTLEKMLAEYEKLY